jgi:uncharacterized protein (TIGR00369 family)
MSKLPLPLSVAEITHLVDSHFPQVQEGNGRVTIERSDGQLTVVRMAYDDRLIRPGGTVSGPAMFKLADFGVYAALLGRLGEAGLQAVTTSMTMNFLSRPQPAALLANIRILKLGRRLAVSEVYLYSEGASDMVAHATSTYAIPPENMMR